MSRPSAANSRLEGSTEPLAPDDASGSPNGDEGSLASESTVRVVFSGDAEGAPGDAADIGDAMLDFPEVWQNRGP